MKHFVWLCAIGASAIAAAQSPAAPGAPPAAAVALPMPALARSAVIPANRWTPRQIGQAFDAADADSNGQLTRVEAQQLAILPRSFEEMDANKDGVVSRGEYEAAFGH